MRCSQTVESGPYVLGALPPAERAAYERHLPTCPTCRDEVSELAGLPGLLGRLDTGTATSIGRTAGAPPALLDTMLIRARTDGRHNRRRQRWQRAGVVLAAACLAGVVGFGAATMGQPASPRPVVATLQPVAGSTPLVTATVGYAPNDTGGTQLVMTCVYPKPAGPYNEREWNLELVVIPRGATQGTTVSTWQAEAGEDFSFRWQLALPPGQIGRIELRREGTPMLAYEAT